MNTENKLKIDDFTKALAECINQAQCAVVGPMAHAEIWKDELIKLAKSEESVSEIDFEQELYKYFGQVKDFTLGMRIAKRFYEIGRNYQETVSEDLEQAYERYVDERMVLLRPDIADMPCGRDTKVSFDIFDGSEVEAAFYEGALWQKQQLMKDAVVMEAHEEYGELWGDITKCSTEKGKKYKVIILKMEGLL